jgi:GNAT superfamily N-acetyltransferase
MTRTGYRRRGAGRLLVEWGLAKAAEEGVPAYIEGSPAGTPLYEKCGFRIVDETPVEGKAVGLDPDFAMTNLAWYPPSRST